MTLSTIERHYLRKELVYLHTMMQSIFKDNIASNMSSEQLDTLCDRRDHIVDKIESLTKVIEQ